MSDVLSYLAYDFAQRAVLAGAIVALLGALIGFFVVLRRMAFVAVGISHAALGGVALGVLLGQSPTLWAIGFAVAVALGMGALAKRGVAEDTAMGVFFPASMAFGVVVMSFTQNWQTNLISYLFGNILGVLPEDLWVLGGVAVVVFLLAGVFFKELLYVSFDEESAHAAGIPVAPMRTLLLVLTAITVVAAIKVVGVVLVSAMLVIPSATASQVTSRWQLMLLGAAGVGLVSLWTGLWLSFTRDVATGPAAVLVATALFGVATLVGRWLKVRAERRAYEAATTTAPGSLVLER